MESSNMPALRCTGRESKEKINMDFILTHRLYIAAACAAGLFTLGVYRKIKDAFTSESKALLADLKTRLDAVEAAAKKAA